MNLEFAPEKKMTETVVVIPILRADCTKATEELRK